MKRILLVSALLLVLPCLVFAGALPDTGQTKCYDAAGSEIIPCPSEGEDFYGQDANYVPCNPHSYVSLSGGIMVLDNVTGLMWENKTDDGSIHDKDNTYNWSAATSVFIATLNSQNFGGYADWRLPTIRELFTIVDNSRTNPSIHIGYFPFTQSANYWSSTTHATSSDGAWRLSFSDGSVDGSSMDDSYYVRAVRGGQ